MDYSDRLIRVYTKLLVRPVWVDGDEETWNLDAKQLSLALKEDGPRLKALDENGRLNVSSLASTPDIDEHNEIVEPTAFASSIESYGENPMMLAFHDMKQPVGLWDQQKVSNAGLVLNGFVSSARPDIQQLVLDGVLSHSSIGFFVKDVEWDDELEVLRIKDLDLIEVSLVPIPANRSTFVTVNDAMKAWVGEEIARRKAAPETPAERPEPEPAEVEPPASDPDDDTADAEILAGIESSICRIGSALAGAVEIAVSE